MTLTSSVDQRALDWLLDWNEAGGRVAITAEGNLEMFFAGSPAMLDRLAKLQRDPLMAQGLGRVILDFFRWEEAGNG